jgi:hypothetical protein
MWDKSQEIDFGEQPEAECRIRPQDQTIEEWLIDYDLAPGLEGPLQNEFEHSGENEVQFKETAVDFEPCPIGMHIARNIRIVDLGTSLDTMYDKEKHDVFFMWEVPGKLKTYTDKEGKEITEPFTVGKYYTMSLSEGSHLRTDLESWRSKPFTAEELQGFDPKNIIGAPCMINVIHKPKVKGSGVSVVITSVTPMVQVDGLQCPPQVHPSVYFSLDPKDFDITVFENLSKGLKSRVEKSNEYKVLTGQQPPPAVEPTQQPGQTENVPDRKDDQFDDIPF